MRTTWRKLFNELSDKEPLLVNTLTEEEMDVEFDGGFGLVKGRPFTAWSENFVYFPIEYDGQESIGSAPRNPCDYVSRHQGGGGW